MNGIEIRGLHRGYQGVEVLRGLYMDVRAGEVVALLGPNGAGKTTTIAILTTLLMPDAGTALVAGHDVATAPDSVRAAIAVTGQSASVDGMLTGRENLEMMMRLWGATIREARARAGSALEEAGLADAADRRASTYSGGMRRRLDLTLGLVSKARVLFLDEPTTGLDTRARAWLWGEVRAAAARGTAVLVTTQYLEEAEAFADRVVILHGGVAVADDTPANLTSSVAAARLELETASGITTLHTDGTVANLRALLADAPEGATVTVRRPTLDDVFLDLTKEVNA